MTLPKRSRFFLQLDLVLKSFRDRGDALPFFDEEYEDLSYTLQRKIDKGNAIWNVGKGDECIIARMERNDIFATLLLQRNNPNTSVQSFHNRKTRVVRPADKHADEDPAVSAHMFIELDHKGNGIFRNRVLLEEVPGLSRSYAQNLLGAVIRDARYEIEPGNPKAGETYVIPKLVGYKSARLDDALHEGRIEGIELIRPADTKGLDTAMFAAKEERLPLKLKVQGRGAIQAL